MMALRPYQRAAIDAVLDYWHAGGGNPLVDMATGTGKSVVIATLARELLSLWPDMRIVMLVHVRELVEQNAKALLRTWPEAPIGINSAGLGRRDKRHPILFASIQSIFRQDAFSLGPRDLVLIDEAHLVPKSGNGMYRTFLDGLRKRTPDLRVAGFTATAYRLDSGRLDRGETDERLFDEVVYSYGIADAVRDGYLSSLVSRGTSVGIDVSAVKRSGGEFVAGDLARAVDKDDLTETACSEIIARGAGRKGWIIFCAGVDHAEHVASTMRAKGVGCAAITSDTPAERRRHLLAEFKAGRLQALASMNVLTTGFDSPHVDLIAMLRPTLSTGLYVQMLGRGTRPVYPAGFDANAADADARIAAIASGPKPDCLVLDFAGNVRRHGPVDEIVIESRGARSAIADDDERGAVKVDTVRARECPTCKTIHGLQVFECDVCGHTWPRPRPKHEARPDETPVMSGGAKPAEAWKNVERIAYRLHRKASDPSAPPTLRIDYLLGGIMPVSEWMCFEHTGFARQKAEAWWAKVGGLHPAPASIDEALDRINEGEIAKAEAVIVTRKGDYDRIIGHRIPQAERDRLAQRPRPIPAEINPKASWPSVLRVKSTASGDEIRAAFRSLAKQRHPDAGGSHEAFTNLNRAYQEAVRGRP